MARTKVEAEGLHMDSLDEACLALQLTEEQCSIIREAAQEICTEKAKKKRAPSEFNIFIGSCVKEKTGPVPERFKSCVVEWKKKK